MVAGAALPQWSLAMEARKSDSVRVGGAGVGEPQWSLAMEARKRGDPLECPEELVGAAMEPGHGGQEEELADRVANVEKLAAMEPGHGGQEEGGHEPAHDLEDHAAMEPGHGGQEEPTPLTVSTNRRACRNGAWPWRPGRELA